MSNIALGQYLPLDSKLHKMDPRVKILAMIVLMVAIFTTRGMAENGFIFIMLAMAVLSAKLTFKFILKSLKPMLFMMVFLLLLNLLVIRDGFVLVSIFGWHIYSGAVLQTLFIVTRLVLMIMVTTLLTATTSPLDLTFGIEDLLTPLKVFKVPAHEIAMMISITLRFIPTLIEDTQRIMNAQASRGVDLQEGSLKEKINGIVSMIIPIFILSFHRAEDLADAMESKGYYPGKVRTRYKQLKIKFSDIGLFLIAVMILVVTIVMGMV